MDLKIFVGGKFTEQDYNDFAKVNITGQHTVLPDGSIFVFYKPITDLGASKMDQIAEYDKLVRLAQVDIITETAKINEREQKISDIKEKMNKLDPSQGEHKTLSQELMVNENAILMSKDNLKNSNTAITAIKETAKDLTDAEPK